MVVIEHLYFIGGNPRDFRDFGAKVGFVIGEGDDAETHTITSTFNPDQG